jgi:uncharacterized protein YggE
MKTIAAAAILIAALSVRAAPPPGPRTIEVSGVGEVQAPPDVAFIELAVETTGKSAEAATQENAKRMQAVIAALQGSGAPKDAIGTRQLQVYPVYRQQERGGGQAVIDGYRATNGVEVRIKDLTKIGKLVDVGLAKGANRVDQVRFQLEARERPRAQAFQMAVEKAKTAAQVVAAALGVKLGRAVRVEVGDAGSRPMPTPFRAMRMAESADTPVLPDAQTVREQVLVVYEME